MNRTPDRLRNDQYFGSDLPLRLYHHRLKQPFDLHWHEFYELTFVISGEGVNIVNGISSELQPGDLFLLSPADFHEIGPKPGQLLELFNLIFMQHFLSDEISNVIFTHRSGRYAHCPKEESYNAVYQSFARATELHQAVIRKAPELRLRGRQANMLSFEGGGLWLSLFPFRRFMI